ncbi:Spo0B domain-containing protein [Dethiobacter alkaliphilus]|uniref:Signal transduction histidine kinase regulating citrate/malate metabolism n=1 Tax=Dethiobacter alkaliphilus AHT 1 TaxID=555088 RepID=C0GEU8_DETAL|nr:Spo0B domain-containing protein [Dethiobacter alkaliphilus]EEG78130.1 signal transduction histidine kinase regulating citrate/malate metabolism [Dethiobacter alkaliphilus AHT 1]
MDNTKEATEKLISLYRHDFLNILQVVGGMAQLNKTDKLMIYIRKASEEVQQFGRFIGCGDPRLALMIYETLLENVAGNYVLQITGTLAVLPDNVLPALEQTLQPVRALLEELGECTLSVAIHGSDSKLQIYIINDANTEVDWQPVLEQAQLHGLQAEVLAKKNELVLCLDKLGPASEK